MGLLEQLKDKGWHLLPAGLERLLEGGVTGTTVDVNQAIKLALDVDLREIGGGALSSISSRLSKADSIDGNIVVQILKIRNISAPKSNEESKVAPRLLKLTLTDGQTQYSALEGEHISAISLDTPPGTKIYLKNGPIKITQGLLILAAGNVSVLGGKVASLAEKWELGRAMAKYAKGGRIQLSANGPPPWIPFGQKIQQSISNDKNFKSLQTKEKDDSKENAEFTALRNDAIAEATKLGTKKTFGGGAKQLVDANVQKIMDKGFTEDQANHALKLTRNNVHRALSNLQRIEDRKQVQNDIKSGKIEPPQRQGKRGLNGKRDSESDAGSKPSAKVSLFDFLEDILPESDAANKKSTSKETTPINGKDSKQSTDIHSSKVPPNNSYSGSSNIRSSNSISSGSASNQQQTSVSSQYNSASKSFNQQRFENNISSSFANRNSHNGPNSRNYNQFQSQDHNANHSSGTRQFAEYNNNRYRGSTNAASADYESYPRSRQDSKYNHSQSSYNSYQQHSHYKSDNMNPGTQGNKFSSNTNNNGKFQQFNSGHNSNTESDSKAGQFNNNPGDPKHPRAKSNPYQQQQQSHPTQQGFHSSNKPVQGYTNPSINSNSSDSGSHYGNTNNHHHAQPKMGNHNNNNHFDSGNSVNDSKPQKGSRYGRQNVQHISGPLPNGNATNARQPTPKAPHLPQSQVPGTSHNDDHQFVGGNKHSYTSHDGTVNKMAQLTQATANMQISNKHFSNNAQTPVVSKVPHGQTNRPTGPTTPPSATAMTPVVQKNYIQLPNGFNYNPYQIMGFQNKQTNEFALNVLKSQQFDAMQTGHLAASPPGVPNVQAPIPPGVTIPSPTAVVPSAPILPVISPATTAALPVWKVGDRCLAKYWEDGGFYNAEITGISENTFVVCFLEYGNFEEVLKTDCIPLTQPAPSAPTAMGFHPASAAHLPHPGASIMPQPTLPNAAYMAHHGTDNLTASQHFNQGFKATTSHQYPHHPPMHHAAHQQQRPSKFREQRPMYVPPAQRK
ncbi:tudor domain-containing protein 3 [Toxorhynchites rutilus septentrionalis]|uniref:tudor domain-containing protein 3 n=1 Tax=Toxorhynchites rutilus septentrionalis TaxID=329112 RepID=UPI00247A212B|nr:tudor domain-containing protein 3 [Toxorhynchites rutilus septentrionalis]